MTKLSQAEHIQQPTTHSIPGKEYVNLDRFLGKYTDTDLPDVHLRLLIVHAAKRGSLQYCTTILAILSRMVSLV